MTREFCPMRSFWGLLFAVVLAAAFILTAVVAVLRLVAAARRLHATATTSTRCFTGSSVVTAFFFVLTEAVLVYNMIRFAGDPGRKAQYSHGNHRLEMLWTVVPGVILFLLAVLQINVWADIKYPCHMKDMVEKDPCRSCRWKSRPGNGNTASAIPALSDLEEWQDNANKAATAKEYQRRLPERRDDVFDANDVHTWKGQKTVVFLRTRDVGHAFFVPVFRVKQDSMPGRTIPLWFEANESNTEKVERQGRMAEQVRGRRQRRPGLHLGPGLHPVLRLAAFDDAGPRFRPPGQGRLPGLASAQQRNTTRRLAPVTE